MATGAEVATAYVSLIISGDKIAPGIKKSMGEVERQADVTGKKAGKRMSAGMSSSLKAGLAAGAAVAVAAAGKIIGDSIALAGDLEQSIGAVDAVFKGNADQIHKWAKQSAQSVGLTRNEFNELGSLIGAQLKNGGTAMKDLAPKANNLIKLGADLSSMFGGTTKEAVEALSSALKGERDPIERYGVSLNQAKIDAKAAELGFKKVDGALSDQAKQAATLALIMDQTADSHGNFAKEADTLAGKQQRMKAQWEDIKTELGTKLLPVMSKLVGKINDDILPALEDLATWVQENKVWAGLLAGALGLVAAAVLVITAPVTATVLGLTALGAALVYAYKKSETFRAVVNFAFKVVRNAIAGVVDTVGGLLGIWARMLRGLSKAPGFGWAKGAADAMDNAAKKARDLSDEIRGIKSPKPVYVDIRARYHNFGATGPAPIGVLAPPKRKKALGGRVIGGMPYDVGENGRETFVPDRSGSIIPNHKLGGGIPEINVYIGDEQFEGRVTAIALDAVGA